MKEWDGFGKSLFAVAILLLILAGCSKQSETPESGTFTDSRDGREYKWVTIGTQTWMAENLAYLPFISLPTEDSDTTKCYYVYRVYDTSVEKAQSTSYYKNYGVFYNWPAALDGADSSNTVPSGIQGVCPESWHLPSDAEWDILISLLGGEHLAGSLLKSTKGWSSYDGISGNGTNSSGFNAIPAGLRRTEGVFHTSGFDAVFWSSTGYGEYCAWNRDLTYTQTGVYRYFYNRRYGFSVRCVKDKQSDDYLK